MATQPLVSVLMPLYNGKKYVQEAVESILGQTYENIRLIILNDGSTDASESIVLQFKDKRVRYEKNTKNKGIVKTRNQLLELAEGKYWAIMDCDDVAAPERIAKQVAYLERNPKSAFCGSWARKIDEEGQCIGKMQPPVAYENIRINQLFQSSFIQSSVMLRAGVMKGICYSESFPVAEDFDLWERLLQKGEAYNIPEYLLQYRWYRKNTSMTQKNLMQERRNAILERQLSLLGNFPGNEIAYIAQLGSLEANGKGRFFKDIKQTLKKIQRLNTPKRQYPKVNMAAMLAYRWVFYCMAQKQYRYLIQSLSFLSSGKSVLILLKLLYRKVMM